MKTVTNKPIVTVIIVYYQATNDLLNCLHCLSLLTDETSFEVIIVDNNPRLTKGETKQLTFKNISLTIIQNCKNLGFGQANNIGARLAKGEYLFFLNPDTLPESGLVDKIVNFFKSHPQAGSVSPRQKHQDGKPYKIQGSLELTPIRAIFSESIIHTLWPNNPIAYKYFLKDLNPEQDQQVDAAPAGVCMIEKKAFDEIGGFDPKFFLFFEEHDLAQKLKKINKEVWLLANQKITHIGEQSSQGKNVKYNKDKQEEIREKKSISTIFSESRYYYFYKYFGRGWAQLVNLICSINKWHIILSCLILIYLLYLLLA
ncbi:MAG: glycosyltransferase family 2 protein [Candidatus Pacebacteria bacterium]|nr:glycosyltransferase family 2 protein [Candidatus Paceibacterota bacterium]